MDCLNNIIGLSETTCVCYDTGKPVDYNESKSALYLDQLEGLSLKLIPTDCGEGSLWDKMELARKNAILKFKSDLVSCLGTSNEFVRKPFKGKVGNESWSQTLVINKNFVGQEFCANNIEGGCLLIRSISTLMDTTTTFDLTIYNNISDTPLFLIPGLASEANVVKENVLGTPIELPLYTTECDNLIYYFVYEPVGFNPKNNEISCSCQHKGKVWDQFGEFSGISGDDILDRENFATTKNANGLIFNIEVFCKVSELICKDDTQLDFENDKVSMSMAYAIRYKSGELLLEMVLASGQVDRFTLLDNTRLWGKRNHYVKQYNEHTAWICSKVDITQNDCLACDNSEDLQITGILV